jgi:ABC-type sulfate/molybdate transport systems ATPase subunit
MSLFRPGGLLHGKAVLLATHNGQVQAHLVDSSSHLFSAVNHLGAASHVIVLKDGQIETQGAPTEIDEQCHTLLVERHAQLPKESRAESEDSDGSGTDAPSQSEHESEEQPIAKSSLGLMPYLFFLRMMTWKNAVFCLVRRRHDCM